MKVKVNIKCYVSSLSLTAILLLPIAVQANSVIPAKCPSVAAIMAEKLDYVQDWGTAWLGFKFQSQYDTNDEWSLLTEFKLETKDPKEAKKESIEMLALLRFQSGPIEDEREKGHYICNYTTDNEFNHAVVMTPAVNMSYLSKAKFHR